MKTLSVVIPSYNGCHLLKKNLPAVIAACPQAEIIVVDDASSDDSVKFLKTNYPQVKIVKNKTNQRFAISCNRGVRAAKGDIIILLNSDVVPKKHFLKPLIRHFSDPQVFAVGCLEIQIVNGKREISGKNKCQFKRGFLIHSTAKIITLKKTTENCWASGGSMALDRRKYLKLGGMDPLYKPAYWEDIDLSWRAREQHGWQVLFEPKSQVYHNHETTNISVFGQKKMQLMASRNQILFVWKNIRGRRLLEHFLWLPYHLIFTTIRSQGIFLLAFFQALVKWGKR
jgi:GT2 family glycosyltransferase